MIVTAHQPNFLPGASVVNKMLAANTVILLDEVLYSPHGWTNRNRLHGMGYLTVPVVSGAGSLPINRVQISEHGAWRPRAAKTILQSYPAAPWAGEAADALLRPYRLLCGLNVALLQLTFAHLTARPPLWAFQSHLDGGRSVPVSLAPISVRLAMMVEEVGGTVYLSGPSGRNYLNERPFHQRGITVAYYEHDGPNLCILDMLCDKVGA